MKLTAHQTELLETANTVYETYKNRNDEQSKRLVLKALQLVRKYNKIKQVKILSYRQRLMLTVHNSKSTVYYIR